MRWALLVLCCASRASASPIHCENIATGDFQIDGILDEWPRAIAAHVGAAGGAFALRCAWDGTALAVSLDVEDDRVVRVTGHGHEDRVEIGVSAGGRATKVVVLPGNAIAKAKRSAPAHVAVADSLQPKGFSIETRIPASAIAGFSSSTPALELSVIFHDSDQAAGGADAEIPFSGTIELSSVFEDFLKTVRLAKSDLRVDTMVALDPDRRGKQRLVAGGNVIGVLGEQFAYVTVPGEVRDVAPIALGGKTIISAISRQRGDGTRDVLMLWTVWSGQLSPLAQIEVRKELGKSVLASTWKVVGKELVVTPKPAVGFTEQTWNEEPATDADPILLPWERTKKGVAYSVTGAEIKRRDVKR